MVSPNGIVQVILQDIAALAARNGPQRVIERLDTRSRAIVLLSLTALILVAILLVLVVTAGGRWVRRQARSGYGPTEFGKRSAALRSAPPGDGALPHEDDVETAETIVAQRTDETRPPEE